MHHLPHGVRPPLEDTPDLLVVRAEHVPQQKRGALLGRQALQQYQQRDGQVGCELRSTVRRWRCGRHHGRERRIRRDRFGQPRPRVCRSRRAQSAKPVDREATDHRDEPRFHGLNGLLMGLLPAKIRLLNDVLGLIHVAQHAISEPEETRAMLERDVGRALLNWDARAHTRKNGRVNRM